MASTQSTYKLFTAAIQDGAAAMDIRANGNIEGILFSVSAQCTGAGVMSQELSFISSDQTATNDTTSAVATLSFSSDGAAVSCINENVFIPCMIAVQSGERIYINGRSTGTWTNPNISCTLFISDAVARPTRTRR